MNLTEIKSIISTAAGELGIKEYDVLYSESSDMSTDALNNEISGFSSSESRGLGFRCIVNGRMGHASCQYFTEDELKGLVFRAYENAKYIESDDEAIIFRGSSNYTGVNNDDIKLPTAGELKAVALDIQKMTYEENELVIDGTQCGAGTGSSRTYMFNSYGLELEKSAGYVNYYSYPVVSNGKETEDSGESKLAKNFDNSKKIIKKAVSNAVAKLGADSVESGNYNIVLSGECFCEFLAEFCGCFSARQVKLGLSAFEKKLECAVASDAVTICDDPFSNELGCKNAFDGEGVATFKKDLIKNGVLKTYLYDLAMAKHFGVEPTGNATRGYFSPTSTIAPYFLYIETGSKNQEQLFGMADNGIYITELKSFSASNAVTGDFSIESGGYVIRDGKKAEFVKSFTIADNFFDMLKRIEALSDKRQVVNSGLFRGYAAPDVFIKNISVAGK